MATPNQKAANKLNAQKSTGPRTEEGKAKSSLNDLSHGFASAATIIPGENPEEFKALLDSMALEQRPAGLMEQILVEHMAINQWLILRAFRLQGYVFLSEKVRTDIFTVPHDLALLVRYQTSAQRGLYQAHNQLLKTQKERKKSEIGFESQKAEQPAAPPLPQPKSEPETPPATPVTPDFPVESAVPDVHPHVEIVPAPPSFIKNAA